MTAPDEKKRMPDKVLSVGLKKAALVLHALAFKVDGTAHKEILALVTVVSDAAYRLEELANEKT